MSHYSSLKCRQYCRPGHTQRRAHADFHIGKLKVESTTFNNRRLQSSPAALNVKGRDHDADAIVWLIGAAREHVRVAVMDYLPATLYMGVEAN